MYFCSCCQIDQKEDRETNTLSITHNGESVDWTVNWTLPSSIKGSINLRLAINQLKDSPAVMVYSGSWLLMNREYTHHMLVCEKKDKELRLLAFFSSVVSIAMAAADPVKGSISAKNEIR